MITKENYEAYFLDYIEGNLSSAETDMLLRFLDEHPYLREELSAYGEVTLSASTLAFDASSLYQVDVATDAITRENAEIFAIAEMEHQLSSDKSAELANFIKGHTEMRKELDLVRKTALVADRAIVYPNKSDLKKGVVLFPHVLYRVAGVAAILIFMLYFFLPNTEKVSPLATPSSSTLLLQKEKMLAEQAPPTALASANKIANEVNTEADNETQRDSENASSASLNKSIAPATNKSFVAVTSENTSTDVKKNNVNSFEKMTPVDEVVERDIALTSSFTNQRSLQRSIALVQSPIYYREPDHRDEYLTPKEFIVSLFKKEVLKSDTDGTDVEVEDFNHVLASVSNDKINVVKNDSNSRFLSIHTKGFSLETKIGR